LAEAGGRQNSFTDLPIEEDGDRWCLWRSNQVGFDSRSIFEIALVEKWKTKTDCLLEIAQQLLPENAQKPIRARLKNVAAILTPSLNLIF